jgi:integrase
VVCAGYPAERLKELAGEGWLCKSYKKGRGSEVVNPRYVYVAYRKWCEDNDMEYLPPRNLRTTYATVQQANKVDALVVSRALGHTKLSTDYTHYFMANKPAQIDAAKALSNSLVTFCNTETNGDLVSVN